MPHEPGQVLLVGAGLLGHVASDERDGRRRQIFPTIAVDGHLTFKPHSVLPPSATYLIHPVLASHLQQVTPDFVREAAKRALGQRHYDVQMIGGIVLHRGEIAEMRTGEGKTLVATLATYLNALPGEGVHVVTVNDYLAKRDAE